MSGTLIDRLKGRVHIDTVIFVYYIENDKVHARMLRGVFEAIDRGRLKALTSYLTLVEVLVKPIKAKRFDIVRQYENFLTRSEQLDLQPCEQQVAQKTARIRADHGFRTPDAIQLATAVVHNADCFLTNDAGLRRFTELDVVLVDSP